MATAETPIVAIVGGLAQSETLRFGIIGMTIGKGQRRESRGCARSAPASGTYAKLYRPRQCI